MMGRPGIGKTHIILQQFSRWTGIMARFGLSRKLKIYRPIGNPTDYKGLPK